MKTDSPIIIIGNARSGTSFLSRILDAHPDVVMFGELRFAVVKTWMAMSDIFRTASAYRVQDFFNKNVEVHEELVKTPSLLQIIANNTEPSSAMRRGAIVRRAISEAFSLHERCQTYWGYKEITNAGEADWSIYDAVFPAAWYIHVVRNPVECARSAIWHERQQLKDDVIVQFLKSWTAVFQMSRRRSESNRYYEVRYESLSANAEEALAPILGAIGIGWHGCCGDVLRGQVGARSERFEMPTHLPSLIAAVPDLPDIMNELGYPQTPLSRGPSRGEVTAAKLIPTQMGRWRMCGRVWREEGQAWQFDLDQTHLGSALAAISDDVDAWSRSPLRLFEDGQPLGPGHALHSLIRGRGYGSYSHWQARLIFSTSDNSDPNINGRTYSFELD